MEKRSGWQKLGLRLLAVTAAFGLVQAPTGTAEAISGATPVRVGLLLMNDTIRTAVDTVTLQGREGLGVGFQTNVGFQELFYTGGAVKASLDNYFVSLGQFDTVADAQAMADQVDNLGLPVDILVEELDGSKRYQVISGWPEQAATAEAVRARLAGLGNPVVRGYLRLTTGAVGSIDDAKATAATIRAHGIAAYPTVRQTGEWEVWIGNEVSQEALNTLRTRLQDVRPGTYPTASFTPANYIMMKTSYFAGREIPHVVLCSVGEEIAFDPKGSTRLIKVFERANREYRGQILVQGYNQKPNVINHVAIDEYLYGVVPHEMSTGWPIEALKAQSVAARTYAARKIGKKRWGVADLSDYTYDQAYSGFSREAADTNRAVNETKGQVLMKNGALIDALYSSNNGGNNGDVREIWGSQGFDYLTAIVSPFDHVAAANEPLYYRVQLPSGTIGWMMASGVKKAAANAVGLPTGTTSGGQPLRVIPERSAAVLVTPPAGQRVVILAEEKEFNPFNWQRGPYSPAHVQKMLNNTVGGFTSPIYDLRVTRYGQGWRALEIAANGTPVKVRNADSYRWVFDNMWSTKIKIDALGTYTVLGANEQRSEYPDAKRNGQTLHVLSANGQTTSAVNGTQDKFVILGANGATRVAGKEQSYVISGNGYGHGLGMSQWGANGMAKNGYTYDQILTHYYQGATLTQKQ